MAEKQNGQVQLSEALLKAFDKVVEQKQLETRSTSVIEGKIIDVVDRSQGIYRLEYLSGTFEASASNKNYTYNIGDRVYVIIPDGDMEKTKIILAPIATKNIKVEEVTQDNLYIPYGDNLLFLDFTEEHPCGLCSFRDNPLPDGDPRYFTLNHKEILEAFETSLKYTQTYDLTCKIKTNIDSNRRINGNYGLYLKIPVIQDNISKDYEVTLDIHNMIGFPYNFSVYTEQHCYFTLPDNTNIDTSKSITLKAFIYDFPKGDEGIVEFVDDVLFANISLTPIKMINAEDNNGYFLKLTASQGAFFASSVNSLSSEKDLIPNLYYNGKLMDLNNAGSGYKCYWFIQDAGIDTNSLGKYHTYGGVGWRILNDLQATIDAEETETYITNIFKYHLKREQIHYELQYKCVIITDNGDIISDTILIKNLATKVRLELTSATGSNVYLENTGKVKLKMNYYETDITDKDWPNTGDIQYSYRFDWQRYDRLGNLQPSFSPSAEDTQPADGSYEQDITFNTQIIDKVNTFTCTVTLVKTSKGEEIDDPDSTETPPAKIRELIIEEFTIGTRSITIQTTRDVTFGVKLENGRPFYKYDAWGNSPLVGNYDGAASSKLALIKPIIISEITNTQGLPFSEEELAALEVVWNIPKENSMIDVKTNSTWNEVTINDIVYNQKVGNFTDLKELNYTIKDVFNKTSTNNTIILQIKLKDFVISEYIPFTFTKDGESGTNGSSYSAVITYQDKAYGEADAETGLPYKCQLLYISGYDEPWFIYNPAWVREFDEDSPVGNRLGLLLISDTTNEVNVPIVKYEVDESGEEPEIVEVIENIAVKSWRNQSFNGYSVNADAFDVLIYCDGELVTYGNNITQESQWEIFDDDYEYGGILSPLNIVTDDATGRISIRTEDKHGNPINWEDMWLYQKEESNNNNINEEGQLDDDISSYSICATLKVKTRAKRQALSNPNVEETTTNSPFYVYAYYPIEVTYISDPSIIYNYIPTLEGGFSDVLYNSSGLIPQYDNSKPFELLGIERLNEIGQDILGQYAEEDEYICSYIWTHSKNLFYDTDKTYSNTLFLKPKGKLENEVTKNYLKSQIKFNDYYKDKLTNLIIETKTKQDDAEKLNTQYRVIKDNKSIFDSFDEGEDNPYDFAVSKISQNIVLLQSCENLQNKVNTIKTEFASLVELFERYYENVQQEMKPQEYRQSYEYFLNTLRQYRDCAFQELGLVRSIKTAQSSQISSILDRIKYLQIDGGVPRDADKRYIFTNTEIGYFNTVMSYKDNKNYYLDTLKNKIEKYLSLMQSLGYATLFNDLVNNSTTFENMGAVLEQIRTKLKTYLSDPRWTNLININPYFDNDLVKRKNSFSTLLNTLNGYYQKIRLDNNLSNPFSIISDYLNRMKTSLAPMKNYSLGSIIENNLHLIDGEKAFQADLEAILNLMNENRQIIHVKPIIMLYNCYENGFLNGWDGNKLQIDNDGGYIMAPQMGAGYKEENNGFTGMVMGVYQKANSGIQRIGLFGKKRGVETLFLDAQTGAAVFGRSGQGQIYIDPDDGGQIYSGNYYSRYDETTGKPDKSSETNQGMRINLQDSYIHLGSSNGYFYSGKHDDYDSEEDGFKLDGGGLSIGKGVRILKTGRMLLGIKDENDRYIEFIPDTDPESNGKVIFKIGEGVDLTASKITVDALKGYHLTLEDGGWIKSSNGNVTIDENGIKILDGEIHLKTGEINLGPKVNGVGKFYVNSNGQLRCTEANVLGTISALDGSTIGNWRVTENGKLYGGEARSTDGRDTIRLDPTSGTLGFWTGATVQSGGKTVRDFAYIGRITGDDNALGFFSRIGKKNNGSGKCDIYAHGVSSAGCAMRTNYIYIGCISEADGLTKAVGQAARISKTGTIQTIKERTRNGKKEPYWG